MTSFWMGSVPSARMASICSLTFMEPSSLAMPEALRPATSSAVSTGPSSRTRRDHDDRANLARRSVGAQRARHLHRDDKAAEEAGEDDDGQAADADDFHLDENVVPIVRRAEDVLERPAREDDEILKLGDRRLREVEH